MTDIENLKQQLNSLNQGHLFDHYYELSTEEKSQLLEEITSYLHKLHVVHQQGSLESDVKQREPVPLDILQSEDNCTCDQLQKYRIIGFQEISKGNVAAVVLAGGQGTRFGAEHPKGTVSIGLPSDKSFFQIQAERIKKLAGSITWYIMTSDFTHKETVNFFLAKKFFGLEQQNVVFFKQASLPVVDTDKRAILENRCKLVVAPNGTGGIYEALSNGSVLHDMRLRGVKHLHIYSVDNILVKVADPVFIGYCIDRLADCGSKTVRKTEPTEKISLFCTIDQKVSVTEYSEIHDEPFVSDLGDICNHYFSLELLNKIVCKHKEALPTHLIKTKTGVFKFEKFIFDAFKFSRNFVLWEVPRYKEFSPVKDSVDASRRDLFYLHKKYVEDAGGIVTGDVVEISPLLSYCGENLEEKVRGKNFDAPLLLN